MDEYGRKIYEGDTVSVHHYPNRGCIGGFTEEKVKMINGVWNFTINDPKFFRLEFYKQ